MYIMIMSQGAHACWWARFIRDGIEPIFSHVIHRNLSTVAVVGDLYLDECDIFHQGPWSDYINMTLVNWYLKVQFVFKVLGVEFVNTDVTILSTTAVSEIRVHR